MIVFAKKKNFPKNTHYSEANFHKCSNPVNCSCESGADYHEICTVTALVINNVMYNRPPTPVRLTAVSDNNINKYTNKW